MVIFGVIANVSIIRLFVAGSYGPDPRGGADDRWYFHVRGKAATTSRPVQPGGRSEIVHQRVLGALSAVIILGGILLGICTATEAAVVSAVYAFVVSAFIYREFKVKHLLPALVNTVRARPWCCSSAAQPWRRPIYHHGPDPGAAGEVLLQLSGGSW